MIAEIKQRFIEFRRRGAAAWRPADRLSACEWIGRNVRLSPEVEAGAGRFDLARRPFMRGIIDAFSDPDVFEITLRKSTQVGGTLTLIALALESAAQSPLPSLVVLPDRDSAIEFRDRLYADAAESPTTRWMVPKRRLWNTRHIDLATMRIYLAWSGSRQRLRGRACGRVYLSEIDVYRKPKLEAGDPNKVARERTKSFWRYTIYRESSPEGDPSAIDDAYQAGNESTWWCCCPHCGHWQELRFFVFKGGELMGRGGIAGFRDAEGNLIEVDAARKAGHYVCVSGCRIDQSEKQTFVESGQWVPRGQHVDKKSGKLAGVARRGPRHSSFHLWSIHAETITFGDLAAAYVEHVRDGKLAEFFGNWLGLRYEGTIKLPGWRRVGRRLAWDYPRRNVPAEAWFLTAGMDVQDDRVYWVVRAWGDQATSWLVDWGQMERSGESEDVDEEIETSVDLASDLIQIPGTVLETAYPVWPTGQRNPLGKLELHVRLAALDSNYRTRDVHEFSQALLESQRRRLRLVRGDHKIDPREMWRMNVIEKNARTGEKYDGGLEQWGLFVNHFKQDLADRLLAPVAKPGAFRFPRDILIVGQDYLRQLVNEPKQFAVVNGRKRLVWKQRTRNIGVDYWDCEVYARAMAEMLVQGRSWDASKWCRQPVRGEKKRQRSAKENDGCAARDYLPGVS